MKKETIIIAIIILITTIVIYLPHYNNPGPVRILDQRFETVTNPGQYPYPIHVDEWSTLALAISIQETQSFPNTNPYSSEPHRNLQSGVHIFIAFIFTITKLDPLTHFQFLPSIIGIITGLICYLFMREYTQNTFISFTAALFLLTIKSNINTLGNAYFTPLTFGILLLFFAIYTYITKNNALFILTIIITVISYPLTTVFLAILITLNELYLKQRIKLILSTISLLILGALIYFGKRIQDIQYFIIFKEGYTEGFDIVWNITDLLPITIITLFFIGFYYIIKQKKVFLLIFLTPIFNILLFKYFNLSMFIPLQRSMTLTLIGITLIASIGLSELTQLFKLNKVKYLALIIIFILSMLNHYTFTGELFTNMHIANEESIEILLYLKNNYPQDSTIATNVLLSFLTYPVAQMRALALPVSNLHTGNLNTLNNFLTGNCETKENIAKEEQITFYLTTRTYTCDWELIKQINNTKIYKLI